MIEFVSDDNTIKMELPFEINSVTSGVTGIITGPRRCGKSTFSFQILKNYHFEYVNFNDERLNI